MIITLDFETQPIMAPNLPPMPVGVALKIDNEEGKYLAWGHPTENNCSREYAAEMLREVWKDVASRKAYLLMHNALFDLSVAEKWLGLPFPDPTWTHDTLLLAFLVMPYEARLSLKPLAEKLLAWPPEERDAVVDWIVANTRHTSGAQYLKAMPKGGMTHFEDGAPKNAAAYIAYAPGGLVGKYAIGDVDRTYALFTKLSAFVEARGMGVAYARERRLIPILAANQTSGMRIDLERGEEQYRDCMAASGLMDEWIRKALGTPELNVNSDDLLDAMLSAGVVDREKLLKTATGKESLSAKSLRLATSPEWSELIVYRRQLEKIGNTFILPWLKQARQFDGKVFTAWNQVAQVRDGKGAGTRTGRFSTTPSFSNLPKVGGDVAPVGLSKLTGLPLPPIPQVRSLVIPWEPGWVLIDRDYSQQEVRISAHFGEGRLLEAFRMEPWMDVHQMTQDALEQEFGIYLDNDRKTARKKTKTVNFRLYYGGGVRGLMDALEIDKDNAAKIRDAVLAVNTGLKMMMEDVQRRANEGKSIRTWGGREYYCEDSPKSDSPGRKALAYKLVNYLIQGSAADNLKEVWTKLGLDPDWFKTYVTVHDEFLASVPAEMIHDGHERLRSAMEGVKFDLPMLSEGTWSATDWAHMQDYDVHGRMVYDDGGTPGVGCDDSGAVVGGGAALPF